jgi:hypothetical protein
MNLPGNRPRTRSKTTLFLGVFFVMVACSAAAQEKARWSFPVSAGYDLYVHDYFLAESDTIEVIQELNVAASAYGASAFGARHRWFLRAGLSGGTELYRESLDTGMRLRTSGGREWLRTDLLWLARQFRNDSEYSLSSDNHEGRLLTAVSPWSSEHVAVELRARGRNVHYATPSTLEVDYTDGSAGLYLRSPGRGFRTWNLGGQYTARNYPDSTEINREGFTLEGDYDHGSLYREFRVFHRSERRRIADETARPSAWFHWSELETAQPVDPGWVILRGSSEIWDYDVAQGAWYDSWLLGGQAGYRWGDPLRSRWEILLTGENLDAGDEPETYSQLGLQIGTEAMSARFSGSVSVEIGQRWYRDAINSTDAFVLQYSDYAFLALWLMGNWTISEHFSVDLTANFEPENHTEQDDNLALGFGSLRLVWRP